MAAEQRKLLGKSPAYSPYIANHCQNQELTFL